MTKPLTNHPVEKYIYNYENVILCKATHLEIGGLALITGVVLGILTYAALHYNFLPIQFGTPGNIAVAISTGSLVTACGIIAVLAHYSRAIVKKDRKSRKEVLLRALSAPESKDLCQPKDNTWVSLRFQHLLRKHFPESNWQGIMKYFDRHFFDKSSNGSKNYTQVYNAFFFADPLRFIRNYCEMHLEDALSQECKNALIPLIFNNLRELDAQEWEVLTLHYPQLIQFFALSTPTYQQDIQQLINRMPLPFFITYFEIPVNGPYSEFKNLFDQNVTELLGQLDTSSWAELIIIIDNFYFEKQADTINMALLCKMMRSPDKFLCAYMHNDEQAYSRKLREHVGCNIPNLLTRDFKPSAGLIESYQQKAGKAILSNELESALKENIKKFQLEQVMELID